jgi:hypothetical protein
MPPPERPLRTGASALDGPTEKVVDPALPVRDFYALHAPPPPSWWKVRTPLEHAHWCWTWADAMMTVRDQATDPASASPPKLQL